MITVFAANALQTQASYPQALMQVQQAQLGVLRQAVKSGECNSNRARQAGVILNATAQDIERAFYPNATVPADFREHAQALRAALDAMEDASACPRFATTVGAVANSCDGCHQSWRQ